MRVGRLPAAVLLLRAASGRAASPLSAAAGTAEVFAIARWIYELQPPPQLVVFATGGGVQLSSFLLATPGASRSVLEVQLPYSRESLVELLDGTEPTKYCAPEVARALAASAFRRAQALRERALGSPPAPCVGLGCTAALRSVPMRRGQHRCFVAVHTETGTFEVSLTLAKGARSRVLEDDVVSRVALLAIAHACGVSPSADETAFWRLASDEEGPSSDQQAAAATRIEAEALVHRFTAHDQQDP